MNNEKNSQNEENEDQSLTIEDFYEFLRAKGKKRIKILLAHAEKNRKMIEAKKNKANQ